MPNELCRPFLAESIRQACHSANTSTGRGFLLPLTGEIDYIMFIQSAYQEFIHNLFKGNVMAKKKRGGKRQGAGRPVNPEGRAVTVTVTIPEGLVSGLKALSKLEGWSKSHAVSEAIRGLLKRKKLA